MIELLEQVILVDKQDNQVGSAEKLRAHELGLLHRAFSVFLLRWRGEQAEILLQQREKNKYHCGGLWTNTCCSHPRIGETVVQAGERRLKEEMGITAKIKTIGSFMYRAEFANGLTEYEYDHVLVGHYDSDIVKFNPQEVQAYRWITVADLRQELKKYPERFTPWLAGALQVCIQY